MTREGAVRRDSRGRYAREPNWDAYIIFMAILTAIFLLKGTGILTALTGIDPFGVTLSIDAGTLGTMFGFIGTLVFLRSESRRVTDRLSAMERRLDRVESARAPPWGG